MAVSTIQANNQQIAFRQKTILSYVRENMFSPYMGEGDNNIIVKLMDSNKARSGNQLNVPILGDLVGPGVGPGTLVGNEEAMDNFGQRVWIDWARNGVALTKDEEKKSSFDIDKERVPLLTRWGKALLRDEIVLTLGSLALESIPANQGNKPGVRVNGVVMAALPSNARSRWVPPSANIATAAQLNTWHTENSDRVVYGNLASTYTAGNHAASLANLTTAAHSFSTVTGTRARDLARLPLPAVAGQAPGAPITPYMTEDTKEWYVCFMGQRSYRALKQDPVMVNANRDARAREGSALDKNPLFQSGDMIYDGVIYREIPEISAYLTRTGAGSGGADVEPFFLCGQAALAVAWGEDPEITERTETDYGFVKGRGFEACYGLTKVARRSQNWGTGFKDFGMVTGFVAVA